MTRGLYLKKKKNSGPTTVKLLRNEVRRDGYRIPFRDLEEQLVTETEQGDKPLYQIVFVRQWKDVGEFRQMKELELESDKAAVLESSTEKVK